MDQLYTQLSSCPGIKVHKKNSTELVESHYSENGRIPPLVVMSDTSEETGTGKSVHLNNNSDYVLSKSRHVS